MHESYIRYGAEEKESIVLASSIYRYLHIFSNITNCKKRKGFSKK